MAELQLNELFKQHVNSVYTYYFIYLKLAGNLKHSDVAALIVIVIDYSNIRQWQLYRIGIRFLLNVISEHTFPLGDPKVPQNS